MYKIDKKYTDLDQFITLIKSFKGIDSALVKQASIDAVKALRQKKTDSKDPLLCRWYTALENSKIDWSVYDDDRYLAELWSCWVIYSKRYLNDIQAPNKVNGKSIVEDIGKINSILDLGCGFGYTTLILSKIFPKSVVYGTNIENTTQIQVAEDLLANTHCSVLTDIVQAPSRVDLVFASEYFEHLQEPILHLEKIICWLNPKYFLIANSFGASAIGHFIDYKVGNHTIDESEMSRLFNKKLRELGYEKIKTKLWNNRPAYWKRKDVINTGTLL
jgi:hypothetical protein